MNYTFEQQQELNRIRDTAMRIACEGLTTAELKELNPNLLRATPELYEACKTMMDEINRGIQLHDVGKLAGAIAKAEGGK